MAEMSNDMSGIMPLNRQSQQQGSYSNRHLESISNKLANLEQRLSTDTTHDSPSKRSSNAPSSRATDAAESIVAGNFSRNRSPHHVGIAASSSVIHSSKKYSSEDENRRKNEQQGRKDHVKKELFTSSFDRSNENQHELSQDIAKMDDVRESLDRIISPINNMFTYQNRDVHHINSSPVSDQLSNGFHDNAHHNESMESMKTEALLSIKPHVSTGSLDSGIVFQPASQRHTYVPDSSLMTENQILRDSLDRERYRRKHCEDQISGLQSKLLESQQQLAVAVSTDRKKDIMVQQLDKTLAKVVDGWKKNEEEKLIVIEKMKVEKEEADKMQDRQKQLLATFEKDLAQAVDQLSKEQKRAIAIEKEKQTEIQTLKDQKEESLKFIQEEKQKRQATEKMKEGLLKQIKELQDKISQERDIALEIQHKLQKELLMLSEKHQKELESEQQSSASVVAKTCEADKKIKSLYSEISELKEQLQDFEQERENLKLEVEMQAAKFEASQLRQETERQTEVEKTVGQRMIDFEKRFQEEQKNLKNIHRQQVQTLLDNHQKEMKVMEERSQEKMQSVTDRWKNVVQDLQQRLDNSNQEMLFMKQNIKQEGGHYIDVIGQFQTQCHQLMNWIQVLSNPDQQESRNQNKLHKDVPRMNTISNLAWTPPKQRQPFTSSSPAVKLTNQQPVNSSTTTASKQTYQHKDFMQELSRANVADKAKTDSSGVFQNRILFSDPTQADVHSFTEAKTRQEVPIGSYPSSVMFTNHAPSDARPEFGSYTEGKAKQEAPVGSFSRGLVFANPAQPEAQQEVSVAGYPGRRMFSNNQLHSDTSSFKPLHPQFDDQQTSSFCLSETIDHVPEKEDSITDLSVGPLESTVIERDVYNSLTDKFQKHDEKQQELQHYIQMLLQRSPGSPVSEESESVENQTATDTGNPSATEVLTLDQLSDISKLIHKSHITDDAVAKQQKPATPEQMMAYLKMMQSRVASVQMKQQNQSSDSRTSHMMKTSTAVAKDKPSMASQEFSSMVQKETRIKNKTSEAKTRTKNKRGSLPQPTRPSQSARKSIWK